MPFVSHLNVNNSNKKKTPYMYKNTVSIPANGKLLKQIVDDK